MLYNLIATRQIQWVAELFIHKIGGGGDVVFNPNPRKPSHLMTMFEISSEPKSLLFRVNRLKSRVNVRSMTISNNSHIVEGST